ncbi:hypothetical protein [Brunnivagina elsteri]|uniref:Uncharacterized protein n=1 Tax=Brunnivagina elsteri CCALA 953 TaxID=987040 RepID=A0A2A2TM79_9CYAN|nr:hypothetical protein [Calothrix elsteri]PAX59656.1 hypothetical protein CK510_06020 [Calothrix elsteri CCALA 953]
MRKIIDVLGIIGIAVSPVILGVAYAQTSVPSITRPVESITEKNFPLNQPQEVTFELNESFQKLAEPQQLTNGEKQGTEQKLSRQQEEQLRDWLLLTVLSAKGILNEKINVVMLDNLTTMRHEFISNVSNFKYGSIRYQSLDNARIVALLPKIDSPEERKNHLATIADNYRKDNGEKPKFIEIFEYEIFPKQHSAIITRRKDINAEEIFSPTYGYYETIINQYGDDAQKINELQSFLNQTNDITFAVANSYGLALGGRKVFKDKNSPQFQGLKVEDIATLFKSEQKILEFQQLYNKEYQSISRSEKEQKEFDNKKIEEGSQLGLLGSAFSLDWEYDYPSLAKALEQVKPLLEYLTVDSQRIISDELIKEAKQGILSKNPDKYLELIEKIDDFSDSKEKNKAFEQGKIAENINKQLKLYEAQLDKENQEKIKQQFEQQIEKDKEAYQQAGYTNEQINSLINEQKPMYEKELVNIQIKLDKDKPGKINEKKFSIINDIEQEIYQLLNTQQSNGFQFARYDGGLRGTEVGMLLFYTDLLMKIWQLNFQKATIETGIEGFKSETQIPLSSIYDSELKKLGSRRLWLEANDDEYSRANENKEIIFSRNITQIQARSSNRYQVNKKEANPRPDTATFVNWWNKHYGEIARHEPQYEKLNQILKWNQVIQWLNGYQSENSFNFLQKVNFKDNHNFEKWYRSQGERLKFRKWNAIKFIRAGHQHRGEKVEALHFLESDQEIDSQYNKPLYGGVSLAKRNNFDPLPQNSSLSKFLRKSNINYKTIKKHNGKLTFENYHGTKFQVENPSYNVSKTIIQPKTGTKFRSPNAELNSEKVKLISKFKATPNNGLKLTTRLEDAKGFSAEFGELNITRTQNGFRTGFENRDIDTGYSLASDLSKRNGDIRSFITSKGDVFSFRYSSSQPTAAYVKQSNSNKWLKLSEGGGGGNGLPPSKSMMTVAEPGKNSRIINVELVDEAQIPGDAQRFGKEVDFLEEGFNPSQKAQKLSEDPMAFVLSSKLDLQSRIKNINSALKNGNYPKAEKLINESIKLHASDPQLMLRKAVVEQRLGRLNIEIVTSKGATPRRQSFFDEIKNSSFTRIETDKVFIYVQDSPSFNNIDFIKRIEASLPSGSGGRLYKLQPGKIGEVPISQSGFGDVSASSHSSTQFKVNNIANSLKNRSQNSDSNDECKNQSAEEEKNQNPNCSPEKSEKPVYVLTESSIK